VLFDFGQPTDGIFQTAFVVEDLDAAIEQFSGRLGVGPFTTMRSVGTQGQLYRGEPSQAALHVGFGFCGHMVYELIQPADDFPSVYREVIDERGYGFHHFGYATPAFDDGVATMRAQGYEIASSAEAPGVRLATFDTRDILPGMVELIEATEAVNDSFTAIWRASIGEGGVPAPPPPAPPSVTTS
jgi:hypothetical protein